MLKSDTTKRGQAAANSGNLVAADLQDRPHEKLKSHILVFAFPVVLKWYSV
jgi:hypothetical protein